LYIYYLLMEKINEDQYQCDVCQRIFTTKRNLYAHLAKTNKCITPEKPKYQCNNCGKQFTRSQGLEYHLNKKNKCIGEYTMDKITDIFRLQQQELQHQIQETIKSQLQLLPLRTNELADNTVNENSNNTTNSHNNLTNSNNTKITLCQI